MVSQEQIYQARQIDLYQFLAKQHSDIVKPLGQSLRLRTNNSISIRQGYYGFKDFSTGETGNGIDLLTKHLGYDFESAVKALLGSSCHVLSVSVPKSEYILPRHGRTDNTALKYLIEERHLDRTIVMDLYASGLIYEDNSRNIVFMNRRGSYFEVHETGETKFRQCHDKSEDATNLWFFNSPEAKEKPNKIFITEGAIDAISLYQLIKEPCFYGSIGGVANRQRVTALKEYGLQIVLAVDDDEAGQRLRDYFPELEVLIPQFGHDWNDIVKKRGLSSYDRQVCTQ